MMMPQGAQLRPRGQPDDHPATRRGPGRCHATVDLGAFRSNLRTIVRHVGPAGVLLVLKADAYGHGAVPLGRLAATEPGIAGLCVVTLGEAIELRRAGIDHPILVLSCVSDGSIARDYDLAVAVTGVADVRTLAVTGGAGLRVHLEVDTGMHRRGIPSSHYGEVCEAIDRNKMTLDGVYTHFACADDLKTHRTVDQFKRFESLLEETPRSVLRHVANSAAALRFPEMQLDAVRVGGAAFGLWTGEATWVRDATTPIMSVRAPIASVVEVPPGDGVGYGLMEPVTHTRRVATLSIGYGDGWPRRLGSGAPVIVKGRSTQTVGRVSMDWAAIDVTDLEVDVGDEAVLLGSTDDLSVAAEDLSDRIGTVSYELTCSIGSRMERRYIEDDVEVSPREEDTRPS